MRELSTFLKKDCAVVEVCNVSLEDKCAEGRESCHSSIALELKKANALGIHLPYVSPA